MTRCYFCGQPITCRSNGFLEFFDQEIGPELRSKTVVRRLPHGQQQQVGALVWPTNGQRLLEAGQWLDYQSIAVHAHADCGPDGYWISYDQLADDGAERWQEHVSRKLFGGAFTDEAIAVAHRVAVRLPARHRPARKVLR